MDTDDRTIFHVNIDNIDIYWDEYKPMQTILTSSEIVYNFLIQFCFATRKLYQYFFNLISDF